ncbi:MAG: YkgJ family cysteine cluster protein [Acidobacteriota bacterium]
MQRERVYFTWPDRRFRYECRGCAACCKGYGIGVDMVAGELVQLVTKRPEVAAFVRKRGDAMTVFNPRERCWFLEDDGMCRVEREDGRAAKPAACRLFPFNRIYRVGTLLVVDYNSVLCPLQVAPPGEGVSHDELLAEMDTVKDPNLTGAVEADDPLFASERAIADAIFGSPTLDTAWTAQGGGDRAVFTSAFETIVGIPWAAPGAATLEAAVLLTPSLRFNELYGPRQYAPRAKMPPLLARMWLAWLGFAALGERLAQRALGVQELTTLFVEQAAVMHAIARWNDTPHLKPGTFRVTPDPLAKAFAELCTNNRKPARSLGELVTSALGSQTPVARIAALKGAEQIIKAAFS